MNVAACFGLGLALLSAGVGLNSAVAQEGAATSQAPSGSNNLDSKRATKSLKQTSANRADVKLKPGHYGTEAEASAKCQGEVVWADQNNFNHYRGSREFGVKPGSFVCG